MRVARSQQDALRSRSVNSGNGSLGTPVGWDCLPKYPAIRRATAGPKIAAPGEALGVVAARTAGLRVIATRLEPGVAAHMIAGQRSREVAHGMVLEHLGLEPLLDLRIRAGEGAGACLASGLICSAVRIRNETGRTR